MSLFCIVRKPYRKCALCFLANVNLVLDAWFRCCPRVSHESNVVGLPISRGHLFHILSANWHHSSGDK